MCATSEIPHAVKRPCDSCAPVTWPRASAGNTPQTWLTFTPAFSNTDPRISRDSPPPCRRWPGGFVQWRALKRCSGSKPSNAAQTRCCRSWKYAVAVVAKSLAALMHIVHEPRDRIRIGVRPDTVSEVEDVPRRGAGLL